MWNWAVVEIKQQANITGPDGLAIVKPCWNIVFKAPYKDEAEGQLVFDGCLVWLENNKHVGSEYTIIEMFLV